MRYYIDLGIYDGSFLEKIISFLPPFDKYIGFEPIPKLCKEARKRFKDNHKVEIKEIAATTVDDDVKLYVNYSKKRGGASGKGKFLGVGSTLIKDKMTGNINEDIFISVKGIDFTKYIINNFDKSDKIVLKIDIEGEEYNLLEKMIKTEAIDYVDKIYCEWHYHKIRGYENNKKKVKKRHYKLIHKLNKLGFDLKGNNAEDEIWEIIKRTNEG